MFKLLEFGPRLSGMILSVALAACSTDGGGTSTFDAAVGGDGQPDDGDPTADGASADGQPEDGAEGDGAPDGDPGFDASLPGDASVTPPDAGAGEDDASTPALVALTQFVDPFIGTDDSDSPFPVPGGAGGSTYPGAVVPFGMVQLSPDTPTASPSGYRFSDTQIDHFSLTHFDGAGCPNNEDLPFLPVVGVLGSSPGQNWASYRSGFDKASETAAPGYYAVTLEDDIEVELTTTVRAGLTRITYPSNVNSHFVIHVGKSATGNRQGNVEIVSPNRLRGTATAGGFCGSDQTFQMHFALEFDRPFASYGIFRGSVMSRGSSVASGTDAGAFVTFDTTSERTVVAKIAISFVSVGNAEANLAAEVPGFDFDAVRAAADQRWNEVLNRVVVRGGNEADLTKFYTALYHVFQNPNVASDVNGDYMGFDKVAHRATDYTVYQNYSGWDIIRSWTHLVSAIAPETPDIIRSMVQDGVEGGLLPFWTHQNVETRVMVGDPGTVNVASAYAMGVRGFDTEAAFDLMVKSATNTQDTQRWGLSEWLNLHYLDSAAMSLEYAMADFAIAQYAGGLGNTEAESEYLARSAWWRESWNAEQGYVLPRVTPPYAGANAVRLYEVQVFGTAGATNLALGRPARASASCNANEGPDKAVNGTYDGGTSDKWCDVSSAQKWWQVDLGSLQRLNRVVLYHAGAGGESAAWNTQDFTIRVSVDGTNWSVAADVVGNALDVSTHTFDPVDARYLRINITTAIQAGVIGSWACQPLDVASDCGFVEGNASQYVWMVPHDLPGVFSRMGGEANAIARLDEHFTELNAGTHRAFFYIGNEPEHGTPWTYNFAAAPWKTQAIVRRILDEEFLTSAGGLPGNDDLGATSAWMVWAYLGMYPVVPGTDVLVIHGPRFPEAVVQLAHGKTLTIRGGAEGSHFIQGLKVDGSDSTRNYLRFEAIQHGATLDYTMGTSANQAWGSAESDLPPRFVP